MRQAFSAILIIICGLGYLGSQGCRALDVYGAFERRPKDDAGQAMHTAASEGPARSSAGGAASSNTAMAAAGTAKQASAPINARHLATVADAAVQQELARGLFCVRAEGAAVCEPAHTVAFGHAVCSCGDILGAGVLSTNSSRSTGRADVGADGSVSLRIGRGGVMGEEPGLIDGSLVVAGLGPATISASDARIRGDLSLYGELTFAGNVHVMGSVYARRLPRGTGALQIDGDLHHAADRFPATPSLGVQVAGRVIEGEYVARPACPCDTSNIVALASAIVTAEQRADPGLARLDREAMSNLTAASSFELSCGQYYLRQISSLSSVIWRVTGHVVVFVGGDLVVASDLTVMLEEGAQLDLLVGGNLLVGGSARFADAERAAASRVYVVGGVELASGALPRGQLSADSVIVGNLYAPSATLQLARPSELYGSVFVRQLLIHQSLLVHYDPAVTRELGASCYE